MPEPIDMIIPMLQRIQTDVGDVKHDVKRLDERLAKLDNRMGTLEERFEAIGTYITFTLGLHARNRADVDTHKDDIASIKQRLDALETGRVS